MEHLAAAHAAVGRFVLVDAADAEVGAADLLILKDVTQHWGSNSGGLLDGFLRKNADSFDKILITNDRNRGSATHASIVEEHGYQCRRVLTNVCGEVEKDTHLCVRVG